MLSPSITDIINNGVDVSIYGTNLVGTGITSYEWPLGTVYPAFSPTTLTDTLIVIPYGQFSVAPDGFFIFKITNNLGSVETVLPTTVSYEWPDGNPQALYPTFATETEIRIPIGQFGALINGTNEIRVITACGNDAEPIPKGPPPIITSITNTAGIVTITGTNLFPVTEYQWPTGNTAMLAPISAISTEIVFLTTQLSSLASVNGINQIKIITANGCAASIVPCTMISNRSKSKIQNKLDDRIETANEIIIRNGCQTGSISFGTIDQMDTAFVTNCASAITIVGATKVLSSNISNYETLVTLDNDIPNKKYVDNAISSFGFMQVVDNTTNIMLGGNTVWVPVPPTNITILNTGEWVPAVATGVIKYNGLSSKTFKITLIAACYTPAPEPQDKVLEVGLFDTLNLANPILSVTSYTINRNNGPESHSKRIVRGSFTTGTEFILQIRLNDTTIPFPTLAVIANAQILFKEI